MKKMWILVLAAIIAIPVVPAIATGGNMHYSGGCQIGQFNYTNGFAAGKYVSFQIDDKTGEIENYKVNGTSVFQSVTYENETYGNVWTRRAVLFYYGMGEKINFTNPTQGKMNFMWRFMHIHDNPAGVFHMVVYGEDTVTYKLASGIDAIKTGNHVITLNGTISGILIFTGNAKIGSNEISITLGTKNYTFGNYEFKGGSVIFIRTGAWNIPSKIKEKVINAIQQGKMGGEMDINEKANDFINYTYGLHANLKVREKNNIQIAVSSENSEGKAIMINVDKSTMNYDEHHNIIVKIDGNKIKMTNENDVLAGGNEGKYAVVDNGNSVTILVYIPHFSSHTLNVESQETSSISGTIGSLIGNPVILAAIAIIIILIIAGVIILIKKH